MVFLFSTYIYSYCPSLKIYYNNIPSLFPCQYYFYHNFKYIIIPSKFIKCAHCVEFNKKYINIFWELLDKICKNNYILNKISP